MIATLGALALALAAATPPETSQITYDVRIIDTPATEWRAQIYRDCARVGRTGRSTVWTIDDAKVADLLDCVRGRIESTVTQPPKVTAFAGAPASFTMDRPRSFVVDVARVAEGPVDDSSAIAYKPLVDQIMEGAKVTIAGRKSPAGVMAHVTIDSSWVAHVATAQSREAVEDPGAGRATHGIVLELPQMVDARVDASYEIPEGRLLLVSLGSATTFDARDRPVVMERLALISARAVPEIAAATKVGSIEADMDADMKRTSFEVAGSRTLPPLPSRSLPGAADVKPVPDDQVSQAGLTGPPVPRATPQMQIANIPSFIDPSVKSTRYESGQGTVDGAQLATGKAQKMRIPLGGPLSIEMEIRVVPNPTRD